jgi:hypothetical protein
MDREELEGKKMADKIQKLEPVWHSLGVGPAPERFTAEGRRAWNDLVELAPAGKWLRMDSIMLEIMADILVAVRKNNMIEIESMGIPVESSLDVLVDLLARFLLGPEDFEKLVGFTYSKPWPSP